LCELRCGKNHSCPQAGLVEGKMWFKVMLTLRHPSASIGSRIRRQQRIMGVSLAAHGPQQVSSRCGFLSEAGYLQTLPWKYHHGKLKNIQRWRSPLGYLKWQIKLNIPNFQKASYYTTANDWYNHRIAAANNHSPQPTQLRPCSKAEKTGDILSPPGGNTQRQIRSAA